MGRRSIVAVFSVCVHGIVLLFAMTADLWRPISEWPTPRSAMAFDVPRPVHIVETPIPKTTGQPTLGPTPYPITTFQRESVPLVVPDGVSKETGEERAMTTLPGGPSAPAGPGDLGTNGIAALPPPPPPAPPAPMRLHSGIQPPRRLDSIAPVYPAIARAAQVHGVVIIEATIDEHGSVVRADVLRSIPLLDAAALDAVRQWKFTPTLLNGVAVPIVMTVTVNFQLQ